MDFTNFFDVWHDLDEVMKCYDRMVGEGWKEYRLASLREKMRLERIRITEFMEIRKLENILEDLAKWFKRMEEWTGRLEILKGEENAKIKAEDRRAARVKNSQYYLTLVGLRGWLMRVEAVAKRDRNKNITEERRLKAKAKKQEFVIKYFFKTSSNTTEEVHALRVDNEKTNYTDTYLEDSQEIDRNDRKNMSSVEVEEVELLLHTPKRKHFTSTGENLTQSATKRRKLLSDFNSSMNFWRVLEGGTDTKQLPNVSTCDGTVYLKLRDEVIMDSSNQMTDC